MLAVHVNGEAGAVKAAGRGAAVHITRAQVLLGGGRDVAVGGGRLRQVQEVAADVTLGAVLTGDVVPAVHQAVDRDDGVLLNGGQHRAVGRGVGADVHAVGIDAAVCSEDIVLIYVQVVSRHIAGAAVVGDLVPAVHGVIQDRHRHTLVQRGDHGGGGRGLGPQPQGRTCGAAGAGGDVRCQGGDHQ